MKILFLPQCLRKDNCKAKQADGYGFSCENCNRDCSVNILRKEAERLNFKVFIAPGGSLVENLYKTYKPEFTVGVACEKEIWLAKKYIKGKMKSIKLLRDGCINTKVDINEVKKALRINI